MRSLLKLIFPDFCLNCRVATESYGLCAECFKQIDFIGDNACLKCGIEFATKDNFEKICAACIKEPAAFDSHISCVAYKSVIAKIIIDYKYHDQQIFHQFLVNLLIQKVRLFKNDFELISPIPMHWRKLFSRDFNQSDYLAKSLANSESKQFCRALVKSKNTAPQMTLGLKERQKNLKGAIEFNQQQDIKGKSILLIDDVYTTGSTLNECAKILKKNGATKVLCLTIARTLKN